MPQQERGTEMAKKVLSESEQIARRPWKGSLREYDLFKEGTIAVIIVTALTLVLAGVIGSPDEPSITLQSWAKAQPNDFVATATTELAGTSETAGYGPPYNNTQGATQTVGPLDLQSLSGVRIPIDTAKDLVITPLSTMPSVPSGVSEWNGASAADQTAWATAYSDALAAAPNNDPAQVATGEYGPVPGITHALLGMAASGALDGVLQAKDSFYNLDYTPTILLLGDGAYFGDLATAQHLTGDQWGMMNETGNYPGQSWLWLFSLFYQIEPFKSAGNADLLVVGVMGVLTLLLALVPFIPGLRTIPRWIPLQRLVWKDYYKKR